MASDSPVVSWSRPLSDARLVPFSGAPDRHFGRALGGVATRSGRVFWDTWLLGELLPDTLSGDGGDGLCEHAIG